MNFKIKGKATFDDYLRMIRRLSNRGIFIALIGGLLVIKIAFTLFHWPDSILYFAVGVYVIAILIDYVFVVPYISRKKYVENSFLSQEREFTFYDGMKFEIPIYKIVYYDDAIYISTKNNQSMIIKKSWLEKDKSWATFTKFVADEIAPQITPKIYRR